MYILLNTVFCIQLLAQLNFYLSTKCLMLNEYSRKTKYAQLVYTLYAPCLLYNRFISKQCIFFRNNSLTVTFSFHFSSSHMQLFIYQRHHLTFHCLILFHKSIHWKSLKGYLPIVRCHFHTQLTTYQITYFHSQNITVSQ